ncbi:MAG TPA: hypothetical protein VKQ05_12870 [Gemmatimonadales bacterium]|nr:hypothetical protein [Gemmatimonadales bacterium]
MENGSEKPTVEELAKLLKKAARKAARKAAKKMVREELMKLAPSLAIASELDDAEARAKAGKPLRKRQTKLIEKIYQTAKENPGEGEATLLEKVAKGARPAGSSGYADAL